jgi:signal peptidase I
MRAAWFQRGWVIGRNPRRTAIRIGALILLATLVFGVILRPTRLSGRSMEPTLAGGHLSLINRWAYTFSSPARGDIVAIRLAGPHLFYVKRVVGLPGERLRIERGVVLINGRPLDEPAVVSPAPWVFGEVVVGPDEYFVIGDNRRMPIRDHSLGRVRRERILGKVVW